VSVNVGSGVRVSVLLKHRGDMVCSWRSRVHVGRLLKLRAAYWSSLETADVLGRSEHKQTRCEEAVLNDSVCLPVHHDVLYIFAA
jgi:hypothetical protein